MDLATGDYYEILGVARGADEREVKRSYFRLVRKYSPESHPEEFKRIREAYEVLSNAVSRKDYDGLTQWGDEIGARMKAGSAAMERADYRGAQAEFKHVLVLQPQLAFARDLLGMAYLNGGQAREALVQFDLLVAQQPSNSVYHLHKGYAHYAMREYAQATVAYKRALELDASDTRVRIALADCYTDTEQYELALAELDRAIHQDGEVNFQDFVFLMRKVQIQLLRNRPDLAEVELDQIVKTLPPDGESRKYVATKLAALAAQMFRVRRSADANRLLARARQLDQSRKSLDLQFPARATIPVRDLPPASQTVLAAMKKSWTPSKLTHRALVGPTLLVLTAIGLGLIGLYSTTASEALWEDGTKVFMFLLLVGTPLLAALAVRRVRRVTSSPFGKFTEVHPLYLLQVDIDKVTAWPLANLHDVALTHHLQNGIYQSTSVRMDFGGVPLVLTIRGQQAAVDWAQHLLDTRHRTLALLADGLLDAEEGLDLIPPELLLGAKKAAPIPGAARNTLLTYLGCGAAGALFFFGVATPLNAASAERGAWSRATGWGASVESYRDYLEQYPSGRHVPEARDAIRAFYDEAKAHFTSRAGASEGGAAMAQVLDALRDGSARQVKMSFVQNAPGASDYAAERYRAKQSWFASQLRQALSGAVSSQVMTLDESPAGDVPAVLELSYTVQPPSRIPAAPGKGRFARADVTQTVDFDFAVVVGGLDKYHFKRTISRTFAESSSDDDVASTVVEEVEAAFEDFARQLAPEIGVSLPRPAPAYGVGKRSNYNYLGNSDELRRQQELIRQILDDAKRRNRYNY